MKLQVKRDTVRKTTIAPVFDLKNKKEDEVNGSPLLPSTLSIFPQTTQKVLNLYYHYKNPVLYLILLNYFVQDVKNISFACIGEPQARDMDWNFEGNEYSPLWPNDYDKVVKGILKNDNELVWMVLFYKQNRKIRFKRPSGS